ncbi:MAG: hypothetical protein IAB16_06080 [Firmicutes bacterium]|uniref:Uncharacterized protein n=1 Tax=Candidatus Stercoripulliclostridium pullicola TaxID=2840953 RepID=A0A940IDL7_9FIRM|nr:hypothetical protein [Candidatus Stercoripulliclostridium pullicola]
MKCIKNNEAKVRRSADVYAIEKAIAELSVLIRQGKAGVVNIQRALRVSYPSAAKIYDLIIDTSGINIKKNIFEPDEKRQFIYLEQLLLDALPDSGYTSDEVYERLNAEMAAIEELGMAADFLFAHSVAGILRELTDYPCFVGIGCCSLVAYIIGITGTELDPIRHGLIFERGFGEDKKPENPFSFFVFEEIMSEFKERINKIYGDSLTYSRDGGSVLSAGDASITILDSIEPLQYAYAQLETSLCNSAIAVFQEDYMRLMHYAAGYDYTEADRIRRIIEKRKIKEILKYRKDFVRKARHLPYAESQRLFTEIQFNLNRACCKAYVLSVKTVLDAYFPF